MFLRSSVVQLRKGPDYHIYSFDYVFASEFWNLDISDKIISYRNRNLFYGCLNKLSIGIVYLTVSFTSQKLFMIEPLRRKVTLCRMFIVFMTTFINMFRLYLGMKKLRPRRKVERTFQVYTLKPS